MKHLRTVLSVMQWNTKFGMKTRRKERVILAGTDAWEREWQRDNTKCGSHIYDESEWSLITSLIWRFWVPYPELAGRSLRRMFPLQYAWWDHLLFLATKCKWSHVSWWQLWSFGLRPRTFRGIENAPCLLTFQKCCDPGELRNPQTSAQLFGMDPGPTTVWGPVA